MQMLQADLNFFIKNERKKYCEERIVKKCVL